MRNTPVALLFGLALLANSCNLNPPEQEVDYQIPDEFALNLMEKRDSATGKTTFGLHFSSLKQFDCLDISIATDSKWVGDELHVSLLKIDAPKPCQPGQAPATAFVGIGDPLNGTFPFTINLGSAVSNQGRLVVSGETASLEFLERAGLNLSHSTLHFMPAEAIWGWVGFDKMADKKGADDFLAALGQLAGQADFNAGFYGDFTMNSPSIFAVHLPKPASLTTLDFVRQTTASRAELEALLTTFRNHPDHDLTIRFWTTGGSF